MEGANVIFGPFLSICSFLAEEIDDQMLLAFSIVDSECTKCSNSVVLGFCGYIPR